MPSFSPDFKSLDEEGIRHGFCASTLTPTGANAEQRKRMMQIVREESQGKIMTSLIAGGTPDAAIASLANAANQVYAHFCTILGRRGDRRRQSGCRWDGSGSASARLSRTARWAVVASKAKPAGIGWVSFMPTTAGWLTFLYLICREKCGLVPTLFS